MNPLLKPQFLNSSTVNKDCNANLIANIYYPPIVHRDVCMRATLSLSVSRNSAIPKKRNLHAPVTPLSSLSVFNFLLAWRAGPTFSATQETMKNARCKKESADKNSSVSAAFQKRFGSKFPPFPPLNNFSDAFRNRGKLERSTNRSKVKN